MVLAAKWSTWVRCPDFSCNFCDSVHSFVPRIPLLGKWNLATHGKVSLKSEENCLLISSTCLMLQFCGDLGYFRYIFSYKLNNPEMQPSSFIDEKQTNKRRSQNLTKDTPLDTNPGWLDIVRLPRCLCLYCPQGLSDQPAAYPVPFTRGWHL